MQTVLGASTYLLALTIPAVLCYPGPADTDRFAETGMAKDLQERSALLDVGMQAAWVYSCPVRGAGTRVTAWKASVDRPLTQVLMTRGEGVEKFDHITLKNGKFSAFLSGDRCVPGPQKSCVYRFRAKTEGWTDKNGAHMRLILSGRGSEDGPSVMEACVDNPKGPGTQGACPAIPNEAFRPCGISDITTRPF